MDSRVNMLGSDVSGLVREIGQLRAEVAQLRTIMDLGFQRMFRLANEQLADTTALITEVNDHTSALDGFKHQQNGMARVMMTSSNTLALILNAVTPLLSLYARLRGALILVDMLRPFILLLNLLRLRWMKTGRHFTLVTDHAPLMWIMTNEGLQDVYSRWALIMSEFDFDVAHRPGALHQNADALSRNPLPSAQDGSGARMDEDSDPKPPPPRLVDLPGKARRCSSRHARAGPGRASGRATQHPARRAVHSAGCRCSLR
jgi:hypothetical protein